MKIIVAGAGHGGLAAAAELAKAGYDVSVYEAKKRNELGHDWEDRFSFDLLLSAVNADKLPDSAWRYRGDCAFVSPDYKTKVVINYTDENRQKIMWRKPLINMLLDNAEKSGVKLNFETEVTAPIIRGGRVAGLKTSEGDIESDLVIDATGVLSPVRTKLPESFGIEKRPKRGDVFYAYRAYFNKTDSNMPKIPFEVYLCHAREQGLSWCCTNEDSVDILIGRIDPLNEKLVNYHIDNFRKTHPYIGNEILHGGNYGIIPVRRPLALMVADGYAAVGDSAFMTTPMNGMGIDLSLQAGKLLADTVIKNSGDASVETLWKYNRDFLFLYGGETAKNEGLKNALLNLPGEGVDFLFESAVIQASDLSGAGKNTDIGNLLGKFARGMKNPPYFFTVLEGIMQGAFSAKLLKSAPEKYDRDKIIKWQDEVLKHVIKISRE
mgnify:FL=1